MDILKQSHGVLWTLLYRLLFGGYMCYLFTRELIINSTSFVLCPQEKYRVLVNLLSPAVLCTMHAILHTGSIIVFIVQ